MTFPVLDKYLFDGNSIHFLTMIQTKRNCASDSEKTSRSLSGEMREW